MTIKSDSQLLEPGARVQLFQLDATVVDVTAGVLHFHGHNKEGVITWQGVEYHPWPIEAKGFALTGEKPPTPTLSVSNLDGTITALCLQFDDLIGSVLTRKSTLAKYLDAVNFEGGVNPDASPDEHFPDQVWYLDRKEHEDHQMVRWALASALDFNGISLPGRLIVANQCFWQYRDGDCGYAGPPVADKYDNPTSDPLLDDCSKCPSGCKLRYGENAELPYGSYPAAGLMRS